MNFEFEKYQGTGNDFVILDNREGKFNKLTEKDIRLMCHRHFGIGADGLLLYQEKEGYDFEMIYYNADGRLSTMCGNGGRCMVMYAYDKGLSKFTYRFIAADGPHEAEIDNNKEVRLKMQDVSAMEETSQHAVLNTGSPHYVKFVGSVEDIDVAHLGREIRNSKKYAAEGINVNFVENIGEAAIGVRTYERGVENETLSCGTGVTAAALACAHNPRGFNRVEVHTPGGNLSVEYNKLSDTSFENIWLCGPATFVFRGEWNLTAIEK